MLRILRIVFLLPLAVLILFAADVYAQSTIATNFVAVRTNTSSYPSVSTLVYGFATGTAAPVAIGTSAITVREAGAPVTSSTTCSTNPPDRLVSMLVAIDVSASVSGGTPTNLDLMKNAAIAASTLIRSSSDELGLVTVDAQANLALGLSTNKGDFGTAVTNVRVSSGFNLNNGLLSAPFGALAHLQNARNRRALLLFTDGANQFDLRSALSTARTFGIRVYVVCVRSTISAELRALADSSGGAYVDNVTTQEEASIYARAYAADVKELTGCNVVWTSSRSCSQSVSAELTLDGTPPVTRTTTYTPPASSYVALNSSTQGLDFGEPSVGNVVSRTVVLTAGSKDIVVDRLDIAGSSYALVSPPNLPLTLRAGQSTPVTIRYTATTTNAVMGTLTVVSATTCENLVVYLRGGSALRGDVLTLVSPNGGEQFLAGTDTVITWKNTLPQDVVRLEYSTDGGASWRTLVESVNGTSYNWRTGPTVSDNLRIRISRTVLGENNVVELVGQSDPVYSVAFTEDGQHVITGGHDGTVRLWNSSTGAEERLIGVHSNWVTDLAVMPGQPIVASAGFDGSVRIWDYNTGQRLATIPGEGSVYSVAFSPSGRTLYFGTLRSVTTVDASSWTTDVVQVVGQGPVYDIAPAANGSLVAVAEGSIATIRDAATLAVRTTVRPGSRTGLLYAVDINPSASQVAIGGADNVISVHDATTGAELASAAPLTAAVLALDFSKDGTDLLAGSGDGTAKIYNAADLVLRSTLAGHQAMVYDAVYSADGEKVATASIDFTGRVWAIDGIGSIQDISDASFRVYGSLATPTAIDMGTVTLGYGVDRQVSALSVSGNEPLTILGLSVVGGDTTDFLVRSTDLPTTITAGTPLTVDASFVPTATGPRSANLDVITGTGVVRVRLTGNGAAPAITAPSVIDFGRKLANSNITDTTITLRVPGSATAPVTVNTTQILGVQGGQYSIVRGGGSFTISPGQSQLVTIRFEPTDFGRFAADLVFEIPGSAPVRVRLYGEATGDGRISTSQAVLFPAQPCGQPSADQTIEVVNFGNTPLQLFSAGIEGNSASEFSIQAPSSFPIELAPLGKINLTVRFNPVVKGAKDARIVITSSAINALNGRSSIPISARRDSVGFELSRSIVDFPNVNEGQQALEKVLLQNTGTLSLRWPRTSTTVGPFRIEPVTPEVTQPGGRSEFVVRFLGGVAGQVYSEQYTFVDSVCGTQQTIRMTATVRSIIGATVRFGTVRTTIGSTASVPVYVTNKINLDRTPANEILAVIKVDGTILTPNGSTPKGTYEADGSRLFELAIPLRQQDSLATTLTFATSWGRDTMSTIHINSLNLTDTLTITSIDGGVILDDICRQGGARLFRLAQQGAGIRVAPLPATTSTTVVVNTVETGRTRVELVDVTGKTIAVVVDKVLQGGSWFVPLDLSTTPSGTYFLVMTTPSQSITERVEVSR